MDVELGTIQGGGTSTFGALYSDPLSQSAIYFILKNYNVYKMSSSSTRYSYSSGSPKPQCQVGTPPISLSPDALPSKPHPCSLLHMPARSNKSKRFAEPLRGITNADTAEGSGTDSAKLCAGERMGENGSREVRKAVDWA